MKIQLVTNDHDYLKNISASQNARISPEQLAKKWRISVENAKKTLKSTTELNLRQPVHPITRRFRTDLSTLRYKRLTGRWFTGTLFSRVKSIDGNTCAQECLDLSYEIKT